VLANTASKAINAKQIAHPILHIDRTLQHRSAEGTTFSMISKFRLPFGVTACKVPPKECNTFVLGSPTVRHVLNWINSLHNTTCETVRQPAMRVQRAKFDFGRH
jgi:hypothetical protein